MVYCRGCGANRKDRPSEEEAIRLWNTRATAQEWQPVDVETGAMAIMDVGTAGYVTAEKYAKAIAAAWGLTVKAMGSCNSSASPLSELS